MSPSPHIICRCACSIVNLQRPQSSEFHKRVGRHRFERVAMQQKRLQITRLGPGRGRRQRRDGVLAQVQVTETLRKARARQVRDQVTRQLSAQNSPNKYEDNTQFSHVPNPFTASQSSLSYKSFMSLSESVATNASSSLLFNSLVKKHTQQFIASVPTVFFIPSPQFNKERTIDTLAGSSAQPRRPSSRGSDSAPQSNPRPPESSAGCTPRHRQ